jgi:hypothetical protein
MFRLIASTGATSLWSPVEAFLLACRLEKEGMMSLAGPGKRVTIVVEEAEQWRHQQLATATVERIRAEGGAGATVVR